MNLRKDHSHASKPNHCALVGEVLGREKLPAQKLAGSSVGLDWTGLIPAVGFRLHVYICISMPSRVAIHSITISQLSATDVSARTTMKGAAKCDKHCELQNSVNQQVLERILRFRDIPESMPASVSTHSHSHLASVVVSFCAPRRTCARDAFSVSSSTR